MHTNDLVVATSGGQIYVGEIGGDPEFVDSDEGRSNLRRPVDWITADSPADFADVAPELSALLRAGSDVVELTEVLPAVEALLPPDPTGGGAEPPEPVLVVLPRLEDEPAADLLVDRAWLDELVDLLDAKRQVILYGPPGTGKTYLALQAANSVCPARERHASSSSTRRTPTRTSSRATGPSPGRRRVRSAFALDAGPFREIVDGRPRAPRTSRTS